MRAASDGGTGNGVVGIVDLEAGGVSGDGAARDSADHADALVTVVGTQDVGNGGGQLAKPAVATFPCANWTHLPGPR